MAKILTSFRNMLAPATIQINLEGDDKRPKIRRPVGPADSEELSLFNSKEPLKGEVVITPLPGKKIEFTSITCEFCGTIEIFGEKTLRNQFISVTKEFEQAGQLAQSKSYPFDFSSIRKDYETYYGINATLRFVYNFSI